MAVQFQRDPRFWTNLNSTLLLETFPKDFSLIHCVIHCDVFEMSSPGCVRCNGSSECPVQSIVFTVISSLLLIISAVKLNRNSVIIDKMPKGATVGCTRQIPESPPRMRNGFILLPDNYFFLSGSRWTNKGDNVSCCESSFKWLLMFLGVRSFSGRPQRPIQNIRYESKFTNKSIECNRQQKIHPKNRRRCSSGGAPFGGTRQRRRRRL